VNHASYCPFWINLDRHVLRRSPASALSRAGREGQAQIAIADLCVIARSGRVDLTEALAWARDHRDDLMARWNELSGDA
jgi:hypothetical protein